MKVIKPNKDGLIAYEEMEKRTSIRFEIDTNRVPQGVRHPVSLERLHCGFTNFFHLSSFFKNPKVSSSRKHFFHMS